MLFFRAKQAPSILLHHGQITMVTKSPSMHIAMDIGAESGRAIVGRFDGSRLSLEEIHRFSSLAVQSGEHLFTDAQKIWQEIQLGLQKCGAHYESQIKSVGVDTWGVDYALLDENQKLIAQPYHYRDRRIDEHQDVGTEKARGTHQVQGLVDQAVVVIAVVVPALRR